MFGKISFDESATMSNERYCWLPWDSIVVMELREDSLGDVI